MNEIEILIISNTLDFSTDYICLELDRRDAKYFRLNRDQFNSYKIELHLSTMSLDISSNGKEFYLSENSLKSVYFRAPTFLRDIYQHSIPPEEQLYRSQWAAFIRDLAIFENALWINHPVATYKAENKLLQLKYAGLLGLECPDTTIANFYSKENSSNTNLMIKSIDTGLLRIGDKEAFIYSNLVTSDELRDSYLSSSPIIIQPYLSPKIDLRITVVDNQVAAVKIVMGDKGVEGDWRKYKNQLDFVAFELPHKTKELCVNLVKSLGLTFGAIDMIQSNGKIYFIEINPTGEWGWLVDNSGLQIHKQISDCLQEGIKSKDDS